MTTQLTRDGTVRAKTYTSPRLVDADVKESQRKILYPVDSGVNHAKANSTMIADDSDEETTLFKKDSGILRPPRHQWIRYNVASAWKWVFMTLGLLGASALIVASGFILYHVGKVSGNYGCMDQITHSITKWENCEERIATAVGAERASCELTNATWLERFTNLGMDLSFQAEKSERCNQVNAQLTTTVTTQQSTINLLSGTKFKYEEFNKKLQEEIVILKQINNRQQAQLGLLSWNLPELMETMEPRWWHWIWYGLNMAVASMMNYGYTWRALVVILGHTSTAGLNWMNPLTMLFGPWMTLYMLPWYLWVAPFVLFSFFCLLLVIDGKLWRLGLQVVLFFLCNIATIYLDFYEWTIISPPLMSGMMALFMWLTPLMMRAALWAQGETVQVTDWKGAQTRTHSQSLLQRLFWWTAWGDNSPTPNPQRKQRTREADQSKPFGLKNPVPFVKQKTRWDKVKTWFSRPKLESDHGQPWVSATVLDRGRPWDFKDPRGSRVGACFGYKGKLITPEHVWETAGKPQSTTVTSPDNKDHVVSLLGSMNTDGESFKTFTMPPGYRSYRTSKMSGTVQCWARTHNGTDETGLSWGVINTHKNTHDVTTAAGDSGTPILDQFGYMLGIHVSSNPSNNNTVRVPDNESCKRETPNGTPSRTTVCQEQIWYANSWGRFPPCDCKDCDDVCCCSFEYTPEAGPAGRKRIAYKKPGGPKGKRGAYKVFTEKEYGEMIDRGLAPEDIRNIRRARVRDMKKNKQWPPERFADEPSPNSSRGPSPAPYYSDEEDLNDYDRDNFHYRREAYHPGTESDVDMDEVVLESEQGDIVLSVPSDCCGITSEEWLVSLAETGLDINELVGWAVAPPARKESKNPLSPGNTQGVTGKNSKESLSQTLPQSTEASLDFAKTGTASSHLTSPEPSTTESKPKENWLARKKKKKAHGKATNQPSGVQAHSEKP